MDHQKFKDVQKRLAECDIAVKAYIHEVYKCDSSFEDLEDINRELAKTIHDHKLAINELENLLWHSKKQVEKDVLSSILEAAKSQLESNYGALRKANNAARSSIEDHCRKNLLSLASEPDTESSRTRKRNVAKDSMAKKASNITDDLLGISRMMSNQVSQSEQALTALIGSSATITETNEEFKMMGNLLSQSRKLLFKYGRREITDKVLIFLALAFFYGCVLYVITKRLF
ncbi:Vesicle transport protein SEC20 [Halotydeus destructor]|nr:Vesicle transport protein SEC20 [Halotydeus destructor]